LQGSFVKYIQQETQTRVQIKGIGSGFVDQATGRESDEPLYIHITYVSQSNHVCYFSHSPSGPEEGQVARAKVLTEDLLLVVRSEHAKVAVAAQQEQMELRQAQMQYAAYTAMASVGLLPSSCFLILDGPLHFMELTHLLTSPGIPCAAAAIGRAAPTTPG
jgi:hypothetical protein